MIAGDTVIAFNKTGKYVGEITGERDGAYTVRILAVLKHPMQGDLHNPKQTDVAFFHERKALAYREQANIPAQMVKPYSEEIPDYRESLMQAVNSLLQELGQEDTAFNAKSIEALRSIMKEYSLMYDIRFE